MRSTLLLSAVLVASVAAPRVAAADVIDDFTLVGGGYTVTFSEPGTELVPDHPHGVYRYDSLSATVNGVPGYSGNVQFLALLLGPLPSLVLNTSIFANEAFYGPTFVSSVAVPTSDPIPYFHPDDLEVTIVPGVYTFVAGFSPPFGRDPFTLTITAESSAATPEPGTLALLCTGLAGGLGLLGRRRTGRA